MHERLDLLSPEVRANPYPYYAELRRSAPVCQVDPGGMWAVSRHDDVAFVLRNAELFSSQGVRASLSAPWLEHNPIADSMVGMDPPLHTRNRALVARAFSTRVVPRMEALMRRVAREFVDALTPGRELDFCAELAIAMPSAVIATLLGLDPSLRSRFRHWADDVVVIRSASTPERIESIKTTVSDLDRYLREVLAARRVAPQDDVVTDLLAAEPGGAALTESEIVSFLHLLLIAGLETTTHLLSNGLRLLMERPALEERLRRDLSLVPAFVEEVLRFEAPTPAAGRVTLHEVTLGGVTLPRGAPIAALMGSATRDETRYPDPDVFDIDRPRQLLLAFGNGPHACLGAPVVRAEGRIAFEAILSLPGRFERVDRPLDWIASMLVRGPRELWVRYVT
ncbi:cytochrome P450 [Chondromyces apiculatus]|uniref:Putative cytochrome P450 hydroxylase n=1 Tax=Chondromyces apiculatus DSM 436 TaxID=1192034 RepID=A0A017TFV2_9BACT|nr:cytochrome P450 [Chondromyces apiculatus]EYF08163.1 putative cytochrome P450 hydroxylase [Chondromyces apiculatus DSM 436]